MTELVLGRYELLRKLGEGGMGLVYLVHDQQEDRHKALKILKSSGFDNKQYEYLRYEFSLQRQLHHPYLVRVFDFHANPLVGRPFFTMEYVAGKTLSQSGDLVQADLLALFVKIARALQLLHTLRILHLDIKPGNVMLREKNGEPVLMDFGISRFAGVAGEGISGTLAYMAPEMMTKRHPVGICSDIFSLGMLFYRLFTQKPVYAATQPATILYTLHQQEYPSPADICPAIPAPVSDLIMRMLAFEAEKRPKSCQEVIHVLSECQRPGRRQELEPARVSFLFRSRYIARSGSERIERKVEQAAGKRPFVIFCHGKGGTGKSRQAEWLKQLMQLKGLEVVESLCLRMVAGNYSFILDVLLKLQGLVRASNRLTAHVAVTIGGGDNQVPDDTLTRETGAGAERAIPHEEPRQSLPAADLEEEIAGLIAMYRNPSRLSLSMGIMKSQSHLDLFYRTCSLLASLSRRIPFAIVIEDVHLDASSLDFLAYYLRFLANYADKCPLGLIMTSREELPAELASPVVTRLHLQPLDTPAAAKLVDSFCASPMPAALHAGIFDWTRGNPLLVQEYLRYLFLQQVLTWRETSWQCNQEKLAGMSRFDASSDLLAANIREIEGLAFQVLAALALAGIPLEHNLLRQVFHEQPVEDALDGLIEAKFIANKSLLGRYRMYYIINDAYVRVITKRLANEVRVALTDKLLNGLQFFMHRHGINPACLAELAFRAGRHKLAYFYAKRSAKLLLQLRSDREALAMMNKAYYSLVACKDMAIAAKLRRLAHMQLSFAVFFLTRHLKVAECWLAKLQTNAANRAGSRLRYSYMDVSARLHMHKHEYKQAETIYQRILQNARSLERDIFIRAAYSYTNLFFFQKNLEKWKSALDKLQPVLERLGYKDILAKQLICQGIFYAMQRDAKAMDYFTRASRIAGDIGNPLIHASCLLNMSQWHREFGRYNKTIHLLRKAAELYTQAGHMEGVTGAYFAMAKIFFERKDNRRSLLYGRKCLLLQLQYGNPDQVIAGTYQLMLAALLNDLHIKGLLREGKRQQTLLAKNQRRATWFALLDKLHLAYAQIFLFPEARWCRHADRDFVTLLDQVPEIDPGTGVIHRAMHGIFSLVREQPAQYLQQAEDMLFAAFDFIDILHALLPYHALMQGNAGWVGALLARMEKTYKDRKEKVFFTNIWSFMRRVAGFQQCHRGDAELLDACKQLLLHDVWLFRYLAYRLLDNPRIRRPHTVDELFAEQRTAIAAHVNKHVP